MPKRTIRLVREAFPDRMALDTAVSQVLLARVAEGSEPETLRLSIPGPAVAFGKHDVVTPGFAEAAQASRDRGYEPFVRLAGGRAAVFHEQTIAMSWAIPDDHPIEGIRDRFGATAALLVDVMESFGIAAAIGSVPGEYCSGEFSVHVGDTKVAGLGQRLAKTAAHIGGVIVVGGGDAVRDVLTPVYLALDLAWDPTAAGALADTNPTIRPKQVVDAMIDRLSTDADIETVRLSAAVLAAAEEAAGKFAVPS